MAGVCVVFGRKFVWILSVIIWLYFLKIFCTYIKILNRFTQFDYNQHRLPIIISVTFHVQRGEILCRFKVAGSWVLQIFWVFLKQKKVLIIVLTTLLHYSIN
jgi:hypothetical protein